VKKNIGGDDRLDDSNINVDTDRDGVVTLRGTVSSNADRERAVDIARRTDGVRKVIDSLNVRAPVERR
jgi:osmotically-inducible protein OsmY